MVEGVGLWRRRRWAEYLTVVATASFVAFEVYELVQYVTTVRVLALLVNVAVVGSIACERRGELPRRPFPRGVDAALGALRLVMTARAHRWSGARCWSRRRYR